MTPQEIESKVIEIVANQMGTDKAQISRNTSFVEDLNADSLDTVELVMELEDEFETNIPDEQAEKIKTVGQAMHGAVHHLVDVHFLDVVIEDERDDVFEDAKVLIAVFSRDGLAHEAADDGKGN